LAGKPFGWLIRFFALAPRFRSEKVSAGQNGDHATATRSFFAFVIEQNTLS